MVAPDPGPFEHEPWRKVPGALGHFLLQRRRADPAPGGNFIVVRHDWLAPAPYEYRAKLVLRARFVELRLVLKLEQKMQGAAQPQLLVEAAVDRRLHGLGTAWMAATAVRPI